MTETKRNTAVGIFVIIGFILLAAIILQFSDLATLARGGYLLTVPLEDSGGAGPGKIVHFHGLDVGNVHSVELNRDGTGVTMVLRIKDDVDVPGNGQVRLMPSGFGDVYIDIVLPRGPGGEPVEPAPPVAKDGSARLTGMNTGSQLIPRSVIDRIEETLAKFDRMDELLANLSELTAPRTLQDVQSGDKAPNLTTAIARFDRTLATLADDENTRNIKETLKSLSTASARLEATLQKAEEMFGKAGYAIDKVAGDVDEVKANSNRLLGKLYDDAVRISNLLDTLNSLAKGVQEGEGTFGKLLKSEDLHKELALLVLQMNQTFKDIDRLAVKLEEQGLLRKGE